MKKLVTLIITGSLFFATGCLFQSGTKAQATVEQMLESHYKAMGKEKLDEVRTIEMHGKTIRRGNEVPFATYIEYPDKFRTETELMGRKMIRVLNGDKGWMVNPRNNEVIQLESGRAEQIRQRIQFGSDLLHYDPGKDKIEYLGLSEFEGTEVYKLKMVREGGQSIVCFLDKDSFVLLRTESTRSIRGNDLEIITMYGNYKKVDGIFVPFSLETKMKNEPERQGRGRRSPISTGSQVVESVKFNKSLDASLFNKPVI